MAIENFTGFDVISDVGDTANSYVSVADTKNFWATDPEKNSFTFTDEEIGRAVITATKQFDTQYWDQYLGTLYDDSYNLFFPRNNITDSRGVEINDFTIFPLEVAEATAIQAFYTASSNRDAEATVSGVKKKELDGVGSLEYFSVGAQANAKKSVTSDEAYRLIAPYIGYGSSRYTTYISRG